MASDDGIIEPDRIWLVRHVAGSLPAHKAAILVLEESDGTRHSFYLSLASLPDLAEQLREEDERLRQKFSDDD